MRTRPGTTETSSSRRRSACRGAAAARARRSRRTAADRPAPRRRPARRRRTGCRRSWRRPGAGLARERGDGLLRERRELDDDRLVGADRADGGVQRVARRHLTAAEGQHEQGGQRPDPATEHGDRVERRVVRPVHVLEHDDRRPRRQLELLEQQRLDVVRRGPARERIGERRRDATAEVADRAERPRHREVVARAESTRVRSGSSRRKRSTSEVLPMPGSPVTNATRPSPRCATRTRRSAPRARPRARAAPSEHDRRASRTSRKEGPGPNKIGSRFRFGIQRARTFVGNALAPRLSRTTRSPAQRRSDRARRIEPGFLSPPEAAQARLVAPVARLGLEPGAGAVSPGAAQPASDPGEKRAQADTGEKRNPGSLHSDGPSVLPFVC